MFEFLRSKEYIDARNREDYYHFGFVDVPRPSWDEILSEFDRQYKMHLTTTYTDIFKYQKHFGFILHACEEMKVVKDFLKAISHVHTIRRKQNFSALAYISMSSESETHGRHKDVLDVWCWQMHGYTLWKVEGLQQNFEKVLEPGELIYVPRGIWHYTKPLTPRAGLSYGSFEIPENEGYINHEWHRIANHQTVNRNAILK